MFNFTTPSWGPWPWKGGNVTISEALAPKQVPSSPDTKQVPPYLFISLSYHPIFHFTLLSLIAVVWWCNPLVATLHRPISLLSFIILCWYWLSLDIDLIPSFTFIPDCYSILQFTLSLNTSASIHTYSNSDSLSYYILLQHQPNWWIWSTSTHWFMDSARLYRDLATLYGL